MTRVSSTQALTDSPSVLLGFLPKDATSVPWFYALVCFASGLLTSALLGVVLPTYADEDDIRSFVSFATGAFICCFLLKKFPVNEVSKVDDKPAAFYRPPKVSCVKEAPWTRPEKQGVNLYLQRAALGAHSSSTPSVSMPPGLELSAAPPARLGAPREQKARLVAPPPLRVVNPAPPVVKKPLTYEPQMFRKEVMAIMRDLAAHKNVGRAVGEVRQWNVPADRQAAEFADILTYAVEETRGNIRRTHIAFIGGLTGAFEKSECLAGLGVFFDGVFQDLCEEVVKLPRLIKIELLPTLNSVLSPEHVAVFVPQDVSAA